MSVKVTNRHKCVVTLDRASAPRIVHYGEGFLREKLPEGTRVISTPQAFAKSMTSAYTGQFESMTIRTAAGPQSPVSSATID